MTASSPTPTGKAPESAPLAFLCKAERQAYEDLAGTAQPLIHVPPKTILRLLAQVQAQEQQLLLHERREAGLRDAVASWEGIGAAYPDFHDPAQEVKEVLDNPHFGDPAFPRPEPALALEGARAA